MGSLGVQIEDQGTTSFYTLPNSLISPIRDYNISQKTVPKATQIMNNQAPWVLFGVDGALGVTPAGRNVDTFWGARSRLGAFWGHQSISALGAAHNITILVNNVA